MSDPVNKAMPQEMARAVNLMAHPLAGAAALSAIGFGVASQALGMWMGAVAGATEASGRLLQTAFDDGQSGQRAAAAAKVRARAKSVMEQAQTVAREVGDATARGVVEKAVAESAAKPVSVAATIAPARGTRPKAIAKPQVPDDLKAIAGIGPKLEQVLNGLGIWTYQQVASLTSEDVAWVEDYVGFKDRIGRDDWIGQAIRLAGGTTRQ